MRNNWNNRRHRDINPLAVIGIIIAVLSVVYLIRNRDNLVLLSADESYVANRVITDNNEFVAIQNYSLEDIYNEICSQINEYKTTDTIVCKSESDMSVVMDLFSVAVTDNPEWF